MKVFRAYLESPIGYIEIISSKAGITAIRFVEEMTAEIQSNQHIEDAIEQLNEYFAGQRNQFELNLDLNGTEFQKKIWTLLQEIESGRTVSYKDIARKHGDLKAIRAIGTTNGRNPLSIVVPCHRVIGSDGSLTGYASGLQRKKWLLDHEKKMTGEYQANLFE